MSLKVAQLLFRVSSESASGTFLVAADGKTHRLFLEKGYVHGMGNVSGRELAGEGRLRQFLSRLSEEADASLEAPTPKSSWERVTPFHPSRAVRLYVDELLSVPAPSERYGEARLWLRYAPHAGCLAVDETLFVSLLGSPRTVDELASRPSLPGRLPRLLAFLDAVGVLVAGDPAVPAAYRLLGLPEGAATDEVRRAYHRLARELHPDQHPHLAEAQRREMAARFDAVSTAYRRISDGKKV